MDVKNKLINLGGLKKAYDKCKAESIQKFNIGAIQGINIEGHTIINEDTAYLMLDAIKNCDIVVWNVGEDKLSSSDIAIYKDSPTLLKIHWHKTYDDNSRGFLTTSLVKEDDQYIIVNSASELIDNIKDGLEKGSILVNKGSSQEHIFVNGLGTAAYKDEDYFYTLNSASELKIQVDTNTSNIVKYGDRIDQLNVKNGQLSNDINTLTTNIASHENMISQLDANDKQLSGDIKKLEDRFNLFYDIEQDDTDKYIDKITEINSYINEHYDEFNSLAVRIASLEDTDSTQTTDIGKLYEKVGTLTVRANKVDNSLNTVQAEVNALATNIAKLSFATNEEVAEILENLN